MHIYVVMLYVLPVLVVARYQFELTAVKKTMVNCCCDVFLEMVKCYFFVKFYL